MYAQIFRNIMVVIYTRSVTIVHAAHAHCWWYAYNACMSVSVLCDKVIGLKVTVTE
jgi:hypothetical protein